MKIWISVPKGSTVYKVLREKGFMKSAYCGGRGICGKCIIKIGGKEELACLTFGPFEGEVELQEETLLSTGETLPDIPVLTPRKGIGVALDIGTTGVEAAAFDLQSGKFIRSFKLLNFQTIFGADIVTRVEEALKGNYRKERELLLQTIDFLLSSLELDVTEVVAVSNSVIHHFFLGLPVEGFKNYPFSPYSTESIVVTGKELGLSKFSNAIFYTPPLIGSFVGSDYLVNVYSLVKEGHENFIVADLGTNAEMGFINKGKGIATSVPAGPAFEGMGLFSGMRAVEGAIYRVFFDGRAFRFLTVGGRKPLGMCASAYFDLIHLLKSFRGINNEGTFVERTPSLLQDYMEEIEGEKAFVLYRDEEVLIALTQSDIRKFLLAKGAVYGGLLALKERMGIPKSVFFSGAFGSHLNPRNLSSLKVIPDGLPLPTPRGNLALKGASLLLGGKKFRDEIEALSKRIEHLELSTDKEFEKGYIEGLEI